MEELSLEQQFNLPLVKDILSENEKLRQTQNLSGTKIPDNKIEKITIPYVIKHRLLMQEGDFNGVFYPKAEIMAKVQEANEKGLILDHLDTHDQGATAWAGQIQNAEWTTGDQGEGLYGDLSIVDKPTAQKLAQGAKWGISPTIDFESSELNGKTTASDLQWKSFSFVIEPAVRNTMLNSQKKNQGETKMVDDKKIVPYKLLNAEGKTEQTLQVEESVLEVLEAKDASIKELAKYRETVENAKKDSFVSAIVANEFLIGRLTSDELKDRTDKLSEKSNEILAELHEVIGNHADLGKFQEFVTSFLKKNPNETIGKAATSYSELKKVEEKKLQDEGGEKPAEPATPAEGEKPAETPAEGEKPAEGGETPATPETPVAQAQLTGQGTTPGRNIGELKDSHAPTSADEAMYNSLHASMFGGKK